MDKSPLLIKKTPIQMRLQRPESFLSADDLETNPLSVGDFMRTLLDYKGTILLVAILGAIVGVLIGSFQPRLYRAEASLEMLVPNEDFLDLRGVQQTAMPPLFSMTAEDSQMKTQVEILDQSWLIERALQKLKAQRNPPAPAKGDAATRASTPPPPVDMEEVQAVKDRLTVEPSHRSRIVRISYDSTDPVQSADMVNALAQTFIEQSTEARSNSMRETQELLQKQLEDLRAKLQKSESELNRFSTSSGLLVGSGDELPTENKLRLLQEELSRAEAERISRESLFNATAGGQSDAVLENEVVRQYRVSLTDLRRQLADLGTILTPESYKVERVKAQIAEIEAALEKELTKGQARLKNEYDAARQRESVLSRSVDEQSSRMLSQSAGLIRYNIMKDDLERTERFYDSIAQKVNEAAIASAIRPSNVRQLSPAQPPRLPHAPNVPLYAGFGIVAGLFTGIGYVTVKERGVRRLRMPGEAEAYLGVPELGAIPSAKLLGPVMKSLMSSGKSGIERISSEQKNSYLSESFRGALVSILSSTRSGQPPRSILVTSALPVEGKTTVASNIAITLSQAQKKVVLIDADLRRPRMHEIFRLDNSRGLTTLLLDEVPLSEVRVEDVIRPTSIPNLYVLPSGPIRGDSSRLLYSDRLDDLIKLLMKEFDHVVIDTPPCLKFADSRILAQRVDGVLLVLRANYTYDKAAMAAAQSFMADGVPVLGTILNDWNPRTSPALGFDRYIEHYGYGIGKN